MFVVHVHASDRPPVKPLNDWVCHYEACDEAVTVLCIFSDLIVHQELHARFDVVIRVPPFMTDNVFARRAHLRLSALEKLIDSGADPLSLVMFADVGVHISNGAISQASLELLAVQPDKHLAIVFCNPGTRVVVERKKKLLEVDSVTLFTSTKKEISATTKIQMPKVIAGDIGRAAASIRTFAAAKMEVAAIDREVHWLGTRMGTTGASHCSESVGWFASAAERGITVRAMKS